MDLDVETFGVFSLIWAIMADDQPLPDRGANLGPTSCLLVKLNHGLVCVQCENFIMKGSDLQINDSKLPQATAGQKVG